MFAKFKFKPTVKFSKNHLLIGALSLLFIASSALNIILIFKNTDLNQQIENVLNEKLLASKEFNLKIEALRAELLSTEEDFKAKASAMDLEVQAATMQAAKCIPLMKKYGIK